MTKSERPLVSVHAQTGLREPTDRETLEQAEYPAVLFHPVVDTTDFRILKVDTSFERPLRCTAPTGQHPKADRRLSPRMATELLLRAACLRAKASTDHESDSASVSLPVESEELSERGFLGTVQGALVAGDVSPRRIELAFSEATLVNASRQAKDRLAELSSWGVALAVSDFGVKYASLAYLADWEFATVKLATSFNRKLAAPLRRPHYPLALIRGLLAVADDLDIMVVASGVDTHDAMRRFRSLGCSVQQGPFFRNAAVNPAAGGWLSATSSVTDKRLFN